MSNPSPIISLLNHSPPLVQPPVESKKPKDELEIAKVSTNESAQDDTQDTNKVPPRKRSKVSRLCDECRRKKIKCDASLLLAPTNSSATTNPRCSNCIKTNEYCTFTRVPLKRGPTKGYIRDFECKVDIESRRNSSISMRSNHFKADSFSHHLPPLPTSLQQPVQQAQLPQPLQQSVPQPIVLPPIDQSRSSVSSNITLSPRSSAPQIDVRLSGSSAATSMSTSNSTGQGHFWKVPYEYSSFNSERRGSADSLSSSISDSFSPFLKNKKPRMETNSVVSDSDDENYLTKRNNTPVTTPLRLNSLVPPNTSLLHQLLNQLHQQLEDSKTRSPDSLSVSSLSSLNNKLNFGLNFENQHLKSPIDLKNVEHNVMLYYQNYHKNCFILPLNSNKFANSITNLNLSSEVEIFILDLFNSSLLLLNNNNKNSQLFTDDIRLVFQQVVKTYPIFSKDISSNEFLKLLFLSTLIILNYCIVLSGQDYSLGLNVSIGIFNDFNIDKLLLELHRNDNLDYDDLIVIYSRLYFNLSGFNSFRSIGYNKISSLPKQDFPITKMLPQEDIAVFKFQQLFINNFTNNDDFIKQLNQIKDVNEFSSGNFSIILSSWKEFLQLFELINGMKKNYIEFNRLGNDDDEEEEEFIFDNFLKITRIVKRLINQMTNIFDNYYQDLISNLNLFSSLIFINFFKILLSLKNLIISIIKFQNKIGNHDLMNRLKKLEIELNSIFYKIFKSLNFQNLNILNNLNFINQRFNKNNQLYDTEYSLNSDTKILSKIDEWLNYLDVNFINLVKDVEYGWLL